MDFKNLTCFIGVDISKAKLNIAMRMKSNGLSEWEIENNPESISEFLIQLGEIPQFNMENSVFCMEHTGIYGTHLLSVLKTANARIAVEHAAKIKYSSGMQRAKDDALDAKLIAEYAERFADKLKEWVCESYTIKELKALHSLRRRLVSAKKQLMQPLEEINLFLDVHISESVFFSSQASTEAIEKDIKAIDKKIHKLIQDDDELTKIYDSMISVPGIGKVTATEIIIRTNGFENVKSAKSLACYAGLAPFGHSSGSSIHKKPKVSKKANARLKSLLFMGAKAAIRHDEEIGKYFEKKIGEGKHYMSVINAVKNKIIHRVFAVVQNNTTYQKNYDYNLNLT